MNKSLLEQQKLEKVKDQAMHDEGQIIKIVTAEEMIDGHPENPSNLYPSLNTQEPGMREDRDLSKTHGQRQEIEDPGAPKNIGASPAGHSMISNAETPETQAPCQISSNLLLQMRPS